MRLVSRQYLTIEVTAETFGLSESTLRAWIADGSLPARRVGDQNGVAIEALRQWHNELMESMRAALSTLIPDMHDVVSRDCVGRPRNWIEDRDRRNR